MAEAVVASIRGFPAPEGPLDLDLHRGARLRIVGPNGSGKTSLLRALAGLDAPLVPTRCTTAPCGFVPQRARDALIGLTVAGEFRLRNHALLEELASMAHRDVATLSHGEARRVALAATTDRALLLLDEPMEGLDAAARNLLRARIIGHAGTVVFVDHDGSLADLATQTISLGASHPPQPFHVPAVDGPALHVPAMTVHRGLTALHFPPQSVPAGLTVVTGPNGAGKSTWLEELSQSHPNAGYLPERAADLFVGHTVADLLANCAAPERFVARELWPRHPLTLSGGEAQRVALAMVFGQPRELILLDEPESHLDAAGRNGLTAAIGEAIDAGARVVMATHDEVLAAAGHNIALEAP